MKTLQRHLFRAFAGHTCLFIFFSLVFLFVCSQKVFAQSEGPLPSVTVINLIRGNGLGHEHDDLVSSLKGQWQVTRESGVNATWLLQYGVLENQDMVKVIKSEMQGQEFGLLFEIDRNYAEKSGVQFRGQGAWYFSDGLFLNSYDVPERRKLIDRAFFKFKEDFGYYPKTVGAWWVGGDSLTYMQETYGITAALRAADQFDLDFYSIWGTPWSIPYIASKENEGIPAKNYDESSKVVILQWAARDPLEGYRDPIYSVQDYPKKEYSSEYVNYLAGIFLSHPYSNLVIGVENGGNLKSFNEGYKVMMEKAREFESEKKANIVFVKDFARQFLDQRQVFPFPSYFLSQDYDSGDQSFWYISENYQVTFQKRDDSVYVADIRDFSRKVEEDFNILPNSQSRLRINMPSLTDSMRFPGKKILLKQSLKPLTIEAKEREVILRDGEDMIADFSPTKMTLFSGKDRVENVYDFSGRKTAPTIVSIIAIMYGAYFFVILIKKKNISATLISFLPLAFPLLFAYFFLARQSVYLFDKKEIILVNILSFVSIFSVAKTLLIVKILPFIILITVHCLSAMVYRARIMKIFYYSLLFLITFLYMHLPYFPLDTSTYRSVGLICILLCVPIFFMGVFFYKKTKTKRNKLLVAFSIPVIIGVGIFTLVFSRSKFALTSYEIDALQVIKAYSKNVIYVEQYENSLRPIYKEIKPLLFVNLKTMANMTGKKFTSVLRPGNHILSITDYDDKLIVIPKYLGSDISDYETNLLGIRKIFDNAQIQIFEKN